MLLFVNSLAHFFVDGVCVSALFSAGREAKSLALAVVLYNTLAFSTQCLVGLWLDRSNRIRFCTPASMLLVVAAYLLPLRYMMRICIAGIGNSLFHVAAGAVTLRNSVGKAWPLGIFVAPGAFGVTLGTSFPQCGKYLSIGLIVCAAAHCFLIPKLATSEVGLTMEPPEHFPLSILLLLTVAVAVRAIGGTAVRFPWNVGAGDSFLITGFVFAGKALGGFVCDRFGAKKTALFSVPIAALLIAFLASYPVPALIGQLLLNLTMPVTLMLLYLSIPDAPAFAFGLAASALWPGTIAGLLFQFSEPALSMCIIFSFIFGLFAILLSIRIIKRYKGVIHL